MTAQQRKTPATNSANSSTSTQSSRWVYLDVLRVLAAVAVVIIHVTAVAVVQPDYPGWWWANLANAASRWSVPVFIMISGALLLGSTQSLHPVSFYTKRIVRLGIPLLFWTFVYTYVFHWWRNDPASLDFIVQRILFDQPYEHFYFLYILLGLCILTPPLAWLLTKLNNWQTLLLTVGAVILTLIWQESRFIGFFVWPYISYYLLGYLFHTYITQQDSVIGAFFSLTAWLIIALGTYLLLSGWLLIDEPWYFYNFLNWPVLIFSVSIFLTGFSLEPLFKSLFADTASASLLADVSANSYGIYLVHPMILLILSEVFLLNVTSFQYLPVGILLLTSIALLLSLALTRIIKMIPLLEKVV